MSSSLRSLLALSALALVACAAPPRDAEPAAVAAPSPAPASDSPGVKKATVTAIQPLSKKKFGAEITEKDNTPLHALVNEPNKFTAKAVRTEGVVSAVCKSMGCWMEIADDKGVAHIKMAGHSFFVPKDCSGHRAVVQGKVVESDANSCSSKDGCRGDVVAANLPKVEFEATGVEFLD